MAPALDGHLSPDLTVELGRGSLPNPVGVASGTFGYGSEYEKLIDLSQIGALYTKAVTLERRPGNSVPRIVETPAGLINSIGLANVGSVAFVRDKAPFLQAAGCPVIANIAGSIHEDYAHTLAYLEERCEMWGYEINLSCPNVKTGGLALGTDPAEVEAVTRRLRGLTAKPLIVKLTPNVTDIGAIARGAEAGGADAVSCINTLVGIVIDIEKRRPVLPGGTGGLSGPAILPVGVAAVYRTARAVSIPVIGIGGIRDPEDAIQYLLAGARAVQIGTANFVDPQVTTRVLEGIENYMLRHEIESMEGFSLDE